MTVTELPNRLGIPDGVYGGEILDKDTFTKSMVKYPDKIEYKHMHKGGEIHITKGDKKVRIALHRDKPEELPDPKIFFKAKGKVNLAKLRELVEERPEEHIFFSTFEEDDRVKLRAWCNEERPGAKPISHETVLSDDIIIDENHRGEKEHQRVIFTRRYFEDLLEALDHQGVDEGYIRLVTDMPLKLEIENREQQTDYYQAPCIGVADPELDYNPENPRTSITSDKYPKQEWRNRAIPYSAFMNTGREEGGNVEVEAQGHRIALRSIDSDHTMLTEVETRNHLDLPNGKYAGDFVERGNKTTLKYPEKLSYDPDTHQLILRKNDDKMIADIAPDAEGYVPKRSKGRQVGEVYLPDLSDSINEAWKHTKNMPGGHLTLKEENNRLILEYPDKNNDKTHRKILAHVKGDFPMTGYDPAKLRDFLQVLDNTDIEHVQLYHDPQGRALTIEGVLMKNGHPDTTIRHMVAPMLGA